MANEILSSPQFKKLYKAKRKKSPEDLMRRVDDGIAELRRSKWPEKIGIRKRGKLSDYYSYDISDGHRILYQVERTNGIIFVNLFRVCDHKNVYGTD
ncbi:MAG: hypothetical protein LBH69_02250 [Methanomassiliicoccaceae archaeon]|nr:hypothetical protein [Methanomassiliicoccaceae archaeon]